MRKSILTLILVAGLATGCATQGTYRVYGDGIIETNAPPDVLSEAIADVPLAQYGDTISAKPASVSNTSRSWRSTTQHEGWVSVTEFTDAAGTKYKIQEIKVGHRPALIILETDSDPQRQQLLSKVVSQLEQQGVKPK